MASVNRVLELSLWGTLEHARFWYYGLSMPRSRDAQVNRQAFCTAYDYIVCPCVVLLWIYWQWYWLYYTVGYVIHSGFVEIAYFYLSKTSLGYANYPTLCRKTSPKRTNVLKNFLSYDSETDARAIIATYYNNINNNKKNARRRLNI